MAVAMSRPRGMVQAIQELSPGRETPSNRGKPGLLLGVWRRCGQRGSGPHLDWRELNGRIEEWRQHTERFVETI